MAITKSLTVVLVSVLVSACVFPGASSRTNQLSEDQAELVSRDFVLAMSKLRGFSPRQTTAQFHNPRTVFSTKLHNTMRDAGYGMQIVPNDEKGANHVSYLSEQFESSVGATVAYEVTVGRVKLGREYEIRAGRVFPVAALSINGGTFVGSKTLDNSIFTQPEDDGWTVVQPSANVVVVEMGGVSEVDENHIGEVRPNLHSPITQKRNVADIGQSNFSSLFELYKPTRSETLVFPDDSLVLGTHNKSTIYSVVKQFNPATDVISVVGCSTGVTAIDNGNAFLANGRANRVKEELIIADVSPESILDEGCWAGTNVENTPARGVVLTLRTKTNQG